MIEQQIKTISVQEFKKRMDESKTICLIDVREADEWQSIRIPGAMHIPKDQLLNLIATTVPNRDQTIYLHCRGGVRSMYAAGRLLEIGYTDVYSLDGGIVEWENAGYPVLKQSS